MNKLEYHIIGSGSSGNAVRIENILIDCGLPFNRIEDDLYLVDTLLITHIHSDHVKEQTLNSIRKKFPRITVYGNPSVAYKFHVNEVIGSEAFTLKSGAIITPFDAVHDVPCTGFQIKMNNLDILYITDTAEVNLDKGKKFDYFFIESNFDETKLREASKKYKRGRYDPADSMYRHLSTQKAKGVFYTHTLRRIRFMESIVLKIRVSKVKTLLINGMKNQKELRRFLAGYMLHRIISTSIV